MVSFNVDEIEFRMLNETENSFKLLTERNRSIRENTDLSAGTLITFVRGVEGLLTVPKRRENLYSEFKHLPRSEFDFICKKKIDFKK